MVQNGALRERLHQATSSARRRLECRADTHRPIFGVQGYRRLLQDFWGFYQPLERKLAVLADHNFPSSCFIQRRKTPRLERDLQSLGMTQVDIAALPLCGRLPAIPTPSQVLGVLYVIDEAAIGERVAAAHVHVLGDTLRISSMHGGSFFSSVSESSHPLDTYREELTAMFEAVEEPDRQELAIHSAMDTLECFETWLDHRAHVQYASSVGTDPERWSSRLESELYYTDRLSDIGKVA